MKLSEERQSALHGMIDSQVNPAFFDAILKDVGQSVDPFRLNEENQGF